MIEKYKIQGSPEWLALRKKMITASEATIIMGLSPWTTRDQLLQEKLGLVEPRPVTSAMRRGSELEPIARRCYEEQTGNMMAPDVVIHQNGWMMASLDGISIDEKLILEIKCTNKTNHELAKNGKIPVYYMPQVQHQIYVCNVDICHYYSFTGSDGIVVPVLRDNEYIARMIELEHEFYQEMCNGYTTELMKII